MDTGQITLTELYDDCESSLRGYAVGLTHDPDHADDLVQETFIRAMGHLALLGQLKGPRQRAWLFRTLKNRLIDERRREQHLSHLLEQIATELPMYQSSPGHFVEEILDAAPEQYRELLYQRFIVGMNSSEIAAELDIPAATVRSRLHLARKWLRQHRSEWA